MRSNRYVSEGGESEGCCHDAPHFLEPMELKKIKERDKGVYGVKGELFKKGVLRSLGELRRFG
jgi:diphthamide synthase (EF-2-diphthine--ammonia ligase)